MSETTEDFQILTLDGGGIKGIFTAAVLAAIEEDRNVRVVDHFDLIAGTSTGGIIALALGLGMSPRAILDLYLTRGRSIFPSDYGFASFRRLFHRKFSSKGLEAALKESFGNKLFGDSTKRLVIPAYNLGEDNVYVFRTAHLPKLQRDWKSEAWKVALATSAAPTYFPSTKLIDSVRLIDGGVWANNPSMVALVEATSALSIPLSRIKMLNLSTCIDIHDRSGRLDSGGIFQWRDAGIDVILRGQSIAAANQARFLLGKDRFFRIDPPVKGGSLSLDSVGKSDALVGKAAHFSRHFMPMIADNFLQHIAPQFNPLNGAR